MQANDENIERPQVSEDNATCTSRLKLHNAIKILSDAAIPVMIGIITLVIAIHQENVAQSNRDRDAEQATELRKQDLELARRQRQEDHEAARLQRLEDREISRLQRELDLEIANRRRLQENEITERQRNLSEKLRTYDFHTAGKNHMEDRLLEGERQRERVLLEYQDDLASHMLQYTDKLDDSYQASLLALRMKTGAALRRLDPARRTILIHNLVEAGFFKTESDDDYSLLIDVNVSGVNFGYSIDPRPYHPHIFYDYLNIQSADITHATFKKIFLTSSPNLNYSNLDHTHWSMAELRNVRFEGEITMYAARFSGCTLYSAVFGKYTNLDRILFESSTTCIHCQFIHSSLLRARLDRSNFKGSVFTSLSMADSNMSNGSFVKSEFKFASLDRVDMSGADLSYCKFISVSMINCSMLGAILNGVNLTNTNLTGCRGLTDFQLYSNVALYQTILPNGTFIERKTFTPK